ncbi:MAG: hypothetical protein OES24_05800 [Acidimicrobiia bacterium]|nr:hypothetical protein [Acidimicrobiia bacterium]
MLTETDPQAAAHIAKRLTLTIHKKRALADMRLLAGDYDGALDLMVPTRRGFGFGYLLDARIAAALLMSGDPSAALELIENHPDADISVRPFAVLRGLCHLELGHRAAAEAEILAEARLGASGRLQHGVDAAALIGMAALAHDAGDDDWAADILLNLGPVFLIAHQTLARWIARRIGVLDQYHQTRVENFGKTLPSAAPHPRQVLARWDETHA